MVITNISKSKKLVASILIYLTLIPALVVIDPVETGLFGYDPYIRTIPELHRFIEFTNLNEFMNDGAAWPLFYSLNTVVLEITNIKLRTTAKYIPLLSVTLPLLYYLFVGRLYDWAIAGFSAVGFASVRTLLMFETKFVDELLAVILLFVLFLLYSVKIKGRIQRTAPVIITISILLAHHFTTVILTLFLLIVLFVCIYNKFDSHTRVRKLKSGNATLFLILVGLSTLFLYFAQDYVLRFSIRLISVLSGQTTATTPSGGVSGLQQTEGLSILSIISRSSIFILFIFALIHIYLFISNRVNPDYELTMIFFSGILSTLYVGFIVLGAFIPVHPIRLLIFLCATILPPAVYTILYVSNILNKEHARIGISYLLIFLFVLSQITAIPPHVIQSDIDQTVVGQGHYSTSQFKASQWSNNYHNGVIAGYEWGLWASEGNEFVEKKFADNNCASAKIVSRSDTSSNRMSMYSTVYTTGDLTLIECKPLFTEN
ncbi:MULTISPECIES: hypothetical protein [Haloarcula]|uniref:hypothetical protein n=1 Tax=Haloarcula TaxID=2237 RepID=UPI000F8EA92D|nr:MULTISPECIES: hypothetical protein [Haloarcula]NHX38166.1 hypothetical protein [Haloarcula sp. R1-2]